MRRPKYNDDYDADTDADSEDVLHLRGRKRISIENTASDISDEYSHLQNMKSEVNGILGIRDHDASRIKSYLREEKEIQKKIDLRSRETYQDYVIDVYKAFKQQ